MTGCLFGLLCFRTIIANLDRYDCFLRGKRISPNGPCYGYRPIVFVLFLHDIQGPDGKAQDYTWYTYNEVWEMVQDFASGLIHQSLVPEKDGVVLN